MPTYQYACTDPACGENFELVQTFTDPSASECPVCGGPVRKVFSAVGVVFKGSGFYRNDSRDATSSKVPAKSGSGEKSGSGDAGSSTKESAPAKESSSSNGSSSSSDSGSSSSSSSSSSSTSTSTGSGSGSKTAASA